MERGHWPSYNVAALPDIYVESGTAEQAKVHGPSASYDLAPRASLDIVYTLICVFCLF